MIFIQYLSVLGGKKFDEIDEISDKIFSFKKTWKQFAAILIGLKSRKFKKF